MKCPSKKALLGERLLRVTLFLFPRHQVLPSVVTSSPALLHDLTIR